MIESRHCIRLRSLPFLRPLAVATCELLAEAGKMTTDKRNEMVLVSDVLGIESLCDM